jgi:hypothetical protein
VNQGFGVGGFPAQHHHQQQQQQQHGYAGMQGPGGFRGNMRGRGMGVMRGGVPFRGRGGIGESQHSRPPFAYAYHFRYPPFKRLLPAHAIPTPCPRSQQDPRPAGFAIEIAQSLTRLSWTTAAAIPLPAPMLALALLADWIHERQGNAGHRPMLSGK